MSKKIIAVWDEGRSQFTIGRGLIFLEEINVLVENLNSDDVTIVWCSQRPIPNLLNYPEWSKSVVAFPNIENAANFIRDNGGIVWGLERPNFPYSYDESLIYLQHSCGKKLPSLKPKEIWQELAGQYLSKYRHNCDYIVALHLKSNPQNSLSNAQFEEWCKFIADVSSAKKSYHFVIVGNEKPGFLTDLPNASWTEGRDILLDMAIIQASDMFMGMSSGFCQLAMFGEKPYTIFKHPGHHTAEMDREFQGNSAFIFNNSKQIFLIEYDSFDKLRSAFSQITSS